MLWICQNKNCKHEFPSNLVRCPKCKQMHEAANARRGLLRGIDEIAERMTIKDKKPFFE